MIGCECLYSRYEMGINDLKRMVMFEIIGTFIVLTILFFVTGGHKKNPNVGKYSRERQRKRFRETGNRRYLCDRDLD